MSDPTEPLTMSEIAQSAQVDADILATQGQRDINSIWERTQQVIALSVVEVTLFAIVVLVFRGEGAEVQLALTVLFGMANLVIGFYFGRTNHQRVGGIAPIGGDKITGR